MDLHAELYRVLERMGAKDTRQKPYDEDISFEFEGEEVCILIGEYDTSSSLVSIVE